MDEITIMDKQITKDSDKIIQLPVNFISVGEVSTDDIKIYIKQDVYKIIEEFSKKDTTRERGGILLGDFVEENKKKSLIISAFVEAKYTDASASTLTFTHETWNYIYKEQEQLYPDLKIVGWQHTHPNYGIFLSNYDIFIQENFFNIPWQIAYVVDPIADTRGFFQWRKDEIEKTGGFFIFDEPGKKITIKQHKEKNSSQRKSGKPYLIIMSLMVLIFAVFAAALYLQRNDMKERITELSRINNEISQQNQRLEEENKADNNHIPSDAVIQEETKDDLQEKDIVKFKVYTIQYGDSLQKICSDNNLDYTSSKDIILKINGISDENKIYSGQLIYLPINNS